MGEPDAGAEWEANALAWIELSRAGADRYRDLVNTPAFLDALPDVTGLHCLDVGCLHWFWDTTAADRVTSDRGRRAAVRP